MKLATRTIRLLLDRPNDPATREMAQSVLELLEAPAGMGFYPEEPEPAPQRPVSTAAPRVDLNPSPRTAGTRESDSPRGSAGYGYHRGPDPAVLLINADEMRILRTIKELRRVGLPYRRIAERLNDKGAPSRSGRPWNLAMVKIQLMRLSSDPELSASVQNFEPLEI